MLWRGLTRMFHIACFGSHLCVLMHVVAYSGMYEDAVHKALATGDLELAKVCTAVLLLYCNCTALGSHLYCIQ